MHVICAIMELVIHIKVSISHKVVLCVVVCTLFSCQKRAGVVGGAET